MDIHCVWEGEGLHNLSHSWLQGFIYCCDVLKAVPGGAEYFCPLFNYVGRLLDKRFVGMLLEDFIDIAGCWHPSTAVII